jgi:hypothetical protein
LQLSDEVIEDNGDSFRILYTATHQQNEIHFVWHAEIEGQSDGTISFSIDGEAHSTFLRNRIGFCVLHPASSAGANCRVVHDDGSLEEKRLPKFIDPNAPFLNIRSIAHEAQPNIWAKLDFTGDVFEMEDQRNWIDASFKTFCTPLALPFPVEIEQGTKISQSVTLKLEGDVRADASTHTEAPIRFSVGEEVIGKLPKLGLAVASHNQKLSARETRLLSWLTLSHLRVDLKLWESEYSQRLKRAQKEAKALNTQLEIAIWLSDNAEQELEGFVESLYKAKPWLPRWMIFHREENTTSSKSIELATEALDLYDVVHWIGGGTDAFFTQLNRERPEVEKLDFVNFSINPQVHAFDNASVVETVDVVGTTVESACQFCPDKPISVSPITLKLRYNPAATGPQRELAAGELPPQVDVRQMSLFGAVWTLGILRGFAHAQAQSLTFYETTGWLGVMETEKGSPVSFPSLPGSVFPIYHVLADVGEFGGADVVVSTHNAPLKLTGLVLHYGNRKRVLLANLTNEVQSVEIAGLNEVVHLRVLDETNAEFAMTEPEKFRAQFQVVETTRGTFTLLLRPYAHACVDAS